MRNYQPGTAIFSTSWEWEEEIYNEATDDYETEERYAEVDVEVYYEAPTRPNYWCGGEPGGYEAEIISCEGDEIPENIVDDIIGWAISEY